MSEKIEPALTPGEWRNSFALLGGTGDDPSMTIERGQLWFHNGFRGWEPVAIERPEKAVAMANAALPDSDTRKITRKMVEAIREEPGMINPDFQLLERIADALESYLRPEEG